MGHWRGSCHCGAVAFELEGEITDAIECNCSLCRRRGSLLAFFPRDALVVHAAVDALATYTFNRHAIRHRFCTTCGVAPFSEGTHPGTGAAMAALNLRCVADLDLAAVSVQQVDGASL